MSNIYYSPEHFGLTPVAELELTDGCYQYDTIVVWRASDDGLVYAEDSGCSCPTPFEYHNITTLTPLRDFHAFRDHVMRRASESWVYASSLTVTAFLNRVRDAL